MGFFAFQCNWRIQGQVSVSELSRIEEGTIVNQYSLVRGVMSGTHAKTRLFLVNAVMWVTLSRRLLELLKYKQGNPDRSHKRDGEKMLSLMAKKKCYKILIRVIQSKNVREYVLGF